MQCENKIQLRLLLLSSVSFVYGFISRVIEQEHSSRILTRRGCFSRFLSVWDWLRRVVKGSLSQKRGIRGARGWKIRGRDLLNSWDVIKTQIAVELIEIC